MSPEQCRGAHIDARSDLFSSAAVLFELLCGGRPFPGRTLADIIQRVMHDPPTDLATFGIDLPPALAAFLDRALAKSPDDRFASATEMAAALRAALNGQAAAETTPAPHEDRTIVLPRAASHAAPANAPSTASASFASHGFERDILVNLERKLTRYVGPIARVLVQQAVRDADTLDSLCAALSASIERPADRTAFEMEILGQSPPFRAQPTPRAATASQSAASAGVFIAESDRAAAQRELARFIGPVAAHLVKRESAAATSPADLWHRLSLHLDQASDRAAFLARRTT
jgi:serine/threonine-protein kinase